MKMFEEWGFWGSLFGQLIVCAIVYGSLVVAYTRGIEEFHRWRFRGVEGARRFLKRLSQWSIPPSGGFDTLEKMRVWSRSGWPMMAFGFTGIRQNLKLIEEGRPQWLYLAIVVTLPLFTALPRAYYRTAKRAFGELGIASLNELPATDGSEREKAAG